MSNEIITLENLKPLEVFGTQGGLDPIIEKIKTQVKGEVFDISTEEGRKRIASVAKKIGSAKARLEEMAMGLTEDWRSQTNAVNAEKKRMKEELDALRDEIKGPLEEYRNREKVRILAHETGLEDLAAFSNFIHGDENGKPLTSAQLTEKRTEAIVFFEARQWEEFHARADAQNEANQRVLGDAAKDMAVYEKEQEELHRLRKEEEERKAQAERDRIAKEAAEKARKEAEAKAQREKEEAAAKAKEEQERVEREKLEAEQRAEAEKKARLEAEERAKADAKAAAEKAEADKAAAVEKERQEAEARRKAEADAQAKREADAKHKAKINGDAANILADKASITYDEALNCVEAIASGAIPNVKINY